MRLALLGVRGSTPAPGAQFLRYGGHTSCLAVIGDGQAVPLLVLDAGTGVRDLPLLMEGKAFEGAVVLSHLHWDHMHGLPFCPALDNTASRVELWVPADRRDHAGGRADGVVDEAETARDLMSKALSPPNFPIGPEGLLGSWTYRLTRPGRLEIESATIGGARIEVAPVQHKGGPAYAIRVDLDGASVAYIPDHRLRTDGLPNVDDAALVDLIHGVDLLIHDGQFIAPEADLAAWYGHSTIEDTMAWADRCAVGELVLTHHAPSRTDDQLDALAAQFTATPHGRRVTFARQGTVMDVVRH